MFIDSHAHLNFKEFGKEISGAIKRASDVGVKVIINVGSNYETSVKTIRIAEKYENLYASCGIHPIHLVKDIQEKAVFDGREYSFKTKQEDFDYEKFKKLAQSSKKVVAIGETGIDLFRIADQKHPIEKITKLQSEIFREHIKLAKKLKLPLIIHGRGTKEDPYGAYDLILKVLKEAAPATPEPRPTCPTQVVAGGSSRQACDGGRGVAHCFVGNLSQAKEFVKLGFYIGFTGIVTFKNAPEIQQIAREIPLEKILIETDCPFLAPRLLTPELYPKGFLDKINGVAMAGRPVPHRGKRNEPAYVVEVAKKIAQLKNITLTEVEKQTTENAIKLFKI